MLLGAKIWKSDTSKFWLAECAALCVTTQGESVEDAREMLDDAIRSVLPDLEFRVDWADKKSGSLFVDTQDLARTLSAIVERNRSNEDMTYAQVAEKNGNSSANSVYAYESGKRTPTIEKLDQLLAAFGKRLVITTVEDHA